jgi:hypothetical protein
VNESKPVRHPVKSTAIIGICSIIFLFLILTAISNIPHYGFVSWVGVCISIGICAGLSALAGCVLYLRRRMFLARSFLLIAATLCFLVFVFVLAYEGIHGDFFLIWFVYGLLYLGAAALVQSCQKVDKKDGPEVARGALFSSPGGVRTRRIRDLTPDDFPEIDQQAFHKWQRDTRIMSTKYLIFMIISPVLSMFLMVTGGIPLAFIGTFLYLGAVRLLFDAIRTRSFRKLGLSRETLRKALRAPLT